MIFANQVEIGAAFRGPVPPDWLVNETASLPCRATQRRFKFSTIASGAALPSRVPMQRINAP